MTSTDESPFLLPYCAQFGLSHHLVIRLENSENFTSSRLRYHECRCIIRRLVLVRAASSKVSNLWINRISLTVPHQQSFDCMFHSLLSNCGRQCYRHYIWESVRSHKHNHSNIYHDYCFELPSMKRVVLHLHLQQCYLRVLSTVNIIVARQHSKYRQTIIQQSLWYTGMVNYCQMWLVLIQTRYTDTLSFPRHCW